MTHALSFISVMACIAMVKMPRNSAAEVIAAVVALASLLASVFAAAVAP